MEDQDIHNTIPTHTTQDILGKASNIGSGSQFNQHEQTVNDQFNAARDVNVIIADFGAAIQFLRSAAKQQQSMAVEKVTGTLKLIAYHQKAVSELKDIHNRLHNLEGLLATFEHRSTFAAPQDDPHLFRDMRGTWRRVKLNCDQVEQVAQQLRFCAEPLCWSSSRPLTGPSWIMPIVIWRINFEQNLKDPVLEVLCELWLEGIDSCRSSLFAVDKALLEATVRLDSLTHRILYSIGEEIE